MNPMPAKITNKTMNSFSPTSAMFTRIDSLMPMLTSKPSTNTSTIAGTSTTPP